MKPPRRWWPTAARVLSSVVATQFELHAQYGGVVPELAARRHLENILPVIQGALDQAGVPLTRSTALPSRNVPASSAP